MCWPKSFYLNCKVVRSIVKSVPLTQGHRMLPRHRAWVSKTFVGFHKSSFRRFLFDQLQVRSRQFQSFDFVCAIIIHKGHFTHWPRAVTISKGLWKSSEGRTVGNRNAVLQLIGPQAWCRNESEPCWGTKTYVWIQGPIMAIYNISKS